MQTAQDRAPLRLGDRAEVGDLKFASTELHGHPSGIFAYWMGHGGEGMSELYDKIKGEVRFRKEVAEKAVRVSSFPTSFRAKSALLDRTDRNSKNPGFKKCLQAHDDDEDATVGA